MKSQVKAYRAAGDVNLSLDWGTGQYLITRTVDMFDGAQEAAVDISSGIGYFIGVTVSGHVPQGVPVIGGDEIGGVGFILSHQISPADTFIILDVEVLGWKGGAYYDLTEGEWHLVGSASIDEAETGKDPFPLPPSSYYYYPQQFDVPAGAASATFTVSWQGDANVTVYGVNPLAAPPAGGWPACPRSATPGT